MTNTTQKWLSRLWSIFVALTIGLMLLGFTSCSTSSEPEPEDPKAKLYATWHVGTSGYLKKDGAVVTDRYAGFEVTFSADGKYTSKNAGLVFKPAGTFSWSGETVELFSRDQNISTQVAIGDNGALRLTFQLDANSVSGRQAATVGNWEIFLQLKK
ncbi:MAG: hypothetical protein ACOYW3_02805 [Bacteroidota bacterium]